MKWLLCSLLLLIGSVSFAEVNVDPSYINDGVYVEGASDAEMIQIQMATGMGIAPCGPRTALGVGCYCNGWVMSHEARAGYSQEGWHWVRNGWHIMHARGGRGGNNLCRRDQ